MTPLLHTALGFPPKGSSLWHSCETSEPLEGKKEQVGMNPPFQRHTQCLEKPGLPAPAACVPPALSSGKAPAQQDWFGWFIFFVEEARAEVEG